MFLLTVEIWHTFAVLPPKKVKLPSLVSLCITVIGKHLQDLIPELAEIAIAFPTHVKVLFYFFPFYFEFLVLYFVAKVNLVCCSTRLVM